MEIIDRYIYAVTQRLPQNQRKDISVELRGLIEDMVEERKNGNENTEEIIEEVLIELGSPRELAQKYRGTKRYLIGPEIFDAYLCVLKIVLIALSASMGIVFMIRTILNPIAILDHFIDTIVTSIVTSFPSAFAWVTLIFVMVEISGNVKEKNIKLDKDWVPSDLSPIPDPKREIKLVEPILGIVFFVFIMALFLFSNDYFGLYIFNNSEFSSVIPFLNIDSFSYHLPFILLILGLSILKEVLKLIIGKWDLKLVLFTLCINIISIIAVLFMITGETFWNPNFMAELTQAGWVTVGSDEYYVVEQIWTNTTLCIVIFLLIGLVVDVISGVIKSRKK
ncbi:hypothetical protein ACFSTA_09790 [Ornithinibacillus salinisoli]|uniref:ABC transporter permease n=1 Tax=Ornithinibacillus salinisoli TaxID=1848459 RepID=A0ABW4VYB9_9BACI